MSIIYINPFQFVAPGPPDPYFANVSLLLHGNGANGSTTIVDNSPSPKTVTPFGNAQINTAATDPFGRAGFGVITFDGNGDYLTTPNDAAFNFGSADFTIETWFYIAGNSLISSLINTRQASIISTESDTAPLDNYQGYALAIQGSSATTGTGLQLVVRSGGGAAPTILSYTGTISQSVWHHVAVTRSSTSMYMFFNGTIVASNLSFSGTVNSSGVPLKIGRRGFISGLDSQLNGYIDELRITKGVARYTSNFTPPTEPFPDIL